jgi:ribonuclease HI
LQRRIRYQAWTPPEKDWIKINVDASFVQEIGDCTVGCVARDHTGNVIWACNRSGVKCQDTVEAEAIACLVGLQFAHDRGVSSVVLESDNAMVVNVIQRQNQGMSRLWSLFEDINRHVSEFCNFSMRKIGRESNGAAPYSGCCS